MTELIEPDFLSQTAEPMTVEERKAWFRLRATEAAEKGATWHRFSLHDDGVTALHEAWKVQPKDQGPIRWQFVAS